MKIHYIMCVAIGLYCICCYLLFASILAFAMAEYDTFGILIVATIILIPISLIIAKEDAMQSNVQERK